MRFDCTVVRESCRPAAAAAVFAARVRPCKCAFGNHVVERTDNLHGSDYSFFLFKLARPCVHVYASSCSLFLQPFFDPPKARTSLSFVCLQRGTLVCAFLNAANGVFCGFCSNRCPSTTGCSDTTLVYAHSGGLLGAPKVGLKLCGPG